MDKTVNNDLKMDNITTFVFISIIVLYIITRLESQDFLSLIMRLILLSFISVIFMWLLLNRSISTKQLLFFLPVVIFQLIYMFNITEYLNIDTIFILIHHMLFFMLLFLVMNTGWNHDIHIKLFAYSFILIFPLLFSLIFLRVGLVNTNTIGGYAFFVSYFIILYFIESNKKFKYFNLLLTIVITLLIIYLSSTRSILFAVSFTLMTFLCWKVITFKKILYNLYFIFILFIIFSITILYPKLYLWDGFYKYNEISIKYTGKSLYSGRNQLWEILLDYISKKPFFGYGSGALPAHFFNTELSAHNLYIQVALQVGLIGLTFIILFLYLIWNKFWLNRKNLRVKLTGAFFIGILVYQIFEITLTQNNFGLGLLQWLIIGIGLSEAINSSVLKS